MLYMYMYMLQTCCFAKIGFRKQNSLVCICHVIAWECGNGLCIPTGALYLQFVFTPPPHTHTHTENSGGGTREGLLAASQRDLWRGEIIMCMYMYIA